MTLDLEKNQEKSAFETENIEEYKQKADLIMANLYQLKGGEKSVIITDYSGKEFEIELDENLSPTENANSYYSLYKKAKIRSEKSKE